MALFYGPQRKNWWLDLSRQTVRARASDAFGSPRFVAGILDIPANQDILLVSNHVLERDFETPRGPACDNPRPAQSSPAAEYTVPAKSLVLKGGSRETPRAGERLMRSALFFRSSLEQGIDLARWDNDPTAMSKMGSCARGLSHVVASVRKWGGSTAVSEVFGGLTHNAGTTLHIVPDPDTSRRPLCWW
jgi:hypothetical protein